MGVCQEDSEKLIAMGFSERDVMHALQVCDCRFTAVDWLLEGNTAPQEEPDPEPKPMLSMQPEPEPEAEQETRTLYVKSSVDGFIELQVVPNITIWGIKNMIYQKKKWSYDMYDLHILFSGKNLDDNKTLQECNYRKNNCPLFLIRKKKEPEQEPAQEPEQEQEQEPEQEQEQEPEPAVAAQLDKSTTVTWSYEDKNETLSAEMSSFLEERFKKYDPESDEGRHADLPQGRFVDFKRMYIASWYRKSQSEKKFIVRA
tara:strand:+ start:119 stop:889 length:771 start_codon:yes stop_codon:yes gene_type:complete